MPHFVPTPITTKRCARQYHGGLFEDLIAQSSLFTGSETYAKNHPCVDLPASRDGLSLPTQRPADISCKVTKTRHTSLASAIKIWERTDPLWWVVGAFYEEKDCKILDAVVAYRIEPDMLCQLRNPIPLKRLKTLEKQLKMFGPHQAKEAKQYARPLIEAINALGCPITIHAKIDHKYKQRRLQASIDVQILESRLPRACIRHFDCNRPMGNISFPLVLDSPTLKAV